jgi:hypothetical protein
MAGAELKSSVIVTAAEHHRGDAKQFVFNLGCK